MTSLNETPPTPERAGGLSKYLPVAGLLALLAASGYLLWRINRLETNVANWQTSMATEITAVREMLTTSSQASEERAETLRGELAATRQEAAVSAGRARTAAQKHAENLAQQLSEEQQKQRQEVVSELSGVKESAASATARISEVSTEVAATKTEVASTKSEIEKTANELKRVTGDLGVMSGLIATNAKELSALKELGERNYFEFSVARTKSPQRVGDVRLLLKKADVKQNRFTIELYADDKRVEKRDRHINEPVQFYVSQARLPYEIVVNEVKKDQIVGYLATPKVQMARK